MATNALITLHDCHTWVRKVPLRAVGLFATPRSAESLSTHATELLLAGQHGYRVDHGVRVVATISTKVGDL